ncbi:MAG: PilW family protein [Desulfuromonadaceae bacterium]|nr:PilW family protein [Desulfuromonadaceae bacterium]MDD2854090.1 PilW family protein [Desulfuromonadaceae bacterium]
MRTKYFCRNRLVYSNENGFTLTELVVVMAIFIILIMISAFAFQNITAISSREIKSADSNIQGIIGLEMMRSDLESAGYGLPYSLNFVGNFEETGEPADHYSNGIDSTIFNGKSIDTAIDANKVPRAVQSATATSGADYELGRDYLVIKSTSIGMNDTAKKWSFIEGVNSTSNIKIWGDAAEDFVEGDEVVVLDARTRTLVGSDLTHFSFSMPAKVDDKFTPPAAYQPPELLNNYIVYGIKKSSTALTYPYSRADFYVKRPTDNSKISSRCATNTGLLYKAIFTGDKDSVSENPLLDCVADMQVVYSMDSNEDGVIDNHGNEDELASLSAEQIRKRLKEIRIYVLTHDGQKDRGFTYSTNSVIHVGDELGNGHDYDLANLTATEWMNYRWKIYSLVVIPKNVIQ